MIEEGEIIVDSFAGGGGASLGIEMALGRSPDIAINHDSKAIAMHMANHPDTRHYCESVWEVDPVEAVGGRKVGLAWFSPDCRHFSKAKGGQPVSPRVRGLAWIVIRWAKRVRPRVIMLENVEEFQDWGPLTEDSKPDRSKRGKTFRLWVAQLKRLGYAVEWKELRAADYGVPTIRKRLFLVARCDGRPIVWPAPTHAKGGANGLLPWRSAAECIDWSIPCWSIFLSKEEGRSVGVNRPLADATMSRIARGIRRYVLEAAEPFLISITHTKSGDGRVRGINEPLNTTTTANRGEQALVSPVLAGVGGRAGQSRPRGVAEPMATLTTKADTVLVAPFLAPRYGERPAKDGKPAQEPRVRSAEEPMATIVPTGNEGQLVAAHLAVFRSDHDGKDLNDPMPTVTANSFHKRPGGAAPLGLVAAFMAQNNTDVIGHPMTAPVSTIVGKGCTQSLVTVPVEPGVGEEATKKLVAGMLSHAYTSNTAGGQGDPRQPLKTVVAGGEHASVIQASLAQEGVAAAHPDRRHEVAAFLTQYNSTAVGREPQLPFGTQSTRDRFGVVAVKGMPITDVCMRMLRERELYRAQGFPDSYVIKAPFGKGFLSRTDQIRMCGNSVCPPLSRAIVAANLGSPDVKAEAAD